jgi:hypothetical protein
MGLSDLLENNSVIKFVDLKNNLYEIDTRIKPNEIICILIKLILFNYIYYRLII